MKDVARTHISANPFHISYSCFQACKIWILLKQLHSYLPSSCGLSAGLFTAGATGETSPIVGPFFCCFVAVRISPVVGGFFCCLVTVGVCFFCCFVAAVAFSLFWSVVAEGQGWDSICNQEDKSHNNTNCTCFKDSVIYNLCYSTHTQQHILFPLKT